MTPVVAFTTQPDVPGSATAYVIAPLPEVVAAIGVNEGPPGLAVTVVTGFQVIVAAAAETVKTYVAVVAPYVAVAALVTSTVHWPVDEKVSCSEDDEPAMFEQPAVFPVARTA